MCSMRWCCLETHSPPRAPALAAHVAAVQWAVHQALQYHGELVRLELVLLSTFARLLADGFCTRRVYAACCVLAPTG